MKRRRYLPNAVRSQTIRKLGYSFFSIKPDGQKKIHLIDKKENYLLLKQKYPKIKKIRYYDSSDGFAFFDELANKAYVLNRTRLQNHTIPIITTALEPLLKCRMTRSGMINFLP